MGKKIVTEYICDRCGKKIASCSNSVFSIGRFRFMHAFKWWAPEQFGGYKLTYVCGDCFKSFKEWYKSDDTD